MCLRRRNVNESDVDTSHLVDMQQKLETFNGNRGGSGICSKLTAAVGTGLVALRPKRDENDENDDVEVEIDQRRRQSQAYLSMGGRDYSEDSDYYTSDLNYPVSGQTSTNMANQYNNRLPVQPQHQQQQFNMNSYDYQAGYYDDGSGNYNNYGQSSAVVPENSYNMQGGAGDYDQDELFYNSQPLK